MKTFVNFILERKYFKVFLLFTLSALFSDVLGQVDWTKYGGNPVLQPGASGTWDDAFVLGTSVYFNNTIYHMWYSGYDGTYIRIGHATSPDGISWTKDIINNPVLNVGTPGSWDDVWVYFPNVVFDGVVYHMWYTGNDGLDNERIGHATSPDGINWTKDPMNPVITPGPSGSWNDESVAGGFVFLEGSTFHIWYHGVDGNYIRVGHATSIDGGTTWLNDPNNPILNVGSSNSWDYPRVQNGSIIYNSITSTYYMFYSGGDFFTWKIGYATSSNLNGPWTKNASPILSTTQLAWDSYYVAFPYVIYDVINNNYKMWYSGGTAPFVSSLGLATVGVVPVELTSFTASANGKEVILNWSTATELNNQGFEIQRKAFGGDFATVAFVKGQGTTTKKNEYSFADKNLDAGKYLYRLKQVDFSGTFEYSKTIEVEVSPVLVYSLGQNFPNPFNPVTTIGYVLQEKGNTKLILMNAIGEEVAILVNEEQDKGYHKVEFNAANLPSGVYFYQLSVYPANGGAGSFVETRKMILLR